MTDVSRRATTADGHLLRRRTVRIGHGEIVALPAIAVGIVQRKDDITSVLITESQLGMLPVEIHKVESERNDEVRRSSGIKRDIEIGITHQFGTNRAETSLNIV